MQFEEVAMAPVMALRVDRAHDGRDMRGITVDITFMTVLRDVTPCGRAGIKLQNGFS